MKKSALYLFAVIALILLGFDYQNKTIFLSPNISYGEDIHFVPVPVP